MKFTNAQIEQMRRELDNPQLMQQRIEEEKQADEFVRKTKERFFVAGRDFDKEFQEWKKNKT